MRILGMMSGTSVDAIDTALVDLSRAADDPGVLRLRWIAQSEHRWPEDLRAGLIDVLPPAVSDVGTWTRLHVRVGERFGEVAAEVLDSNGGAELVVSHSQTLFHWVDPDGSPRGSLQVGDAARIAAATGTPVLYDVRAADLARGGHGAPLAPVLDRLLAGDVPTAVLNLGGISNVTVVDGGRIVAGDLGPANALIDAAVREVTGADCDTDGALAACGTVDQAMLAELLSDPYLSRPLPKSTGREYFDREYVRRRVSAVPPVLADRVATLTEFTARVISDALRPESASGFAVERVIGSGGGMRNPVLRARIADLLAPIPLVDSDTVGIGSDAKEALLMAVIGYHSAHGLPALPPTTGAIPTILGSLTPPVPLTGLDAESAAPLLRLRIED